MYRVTDKDSAQSLPGAPNWEVRRWLAALGVSVCAVSLTLSAHMRGQAYEAAQQEALLLAEKDALAEEFADWQFASVEQQIMVADGEAVKADDGVIAGGFQVARADVSDLADVSHLVSYDFTELDVARIQSAERRCLADAIYYESRNESMLGKLGVADVVLNRVKSSYYPDTICGVVYQGAERTTGCQFSFTCDGSMDRRARTAMYDEIDELAGVIIAGMHIPVSRNATHYHADYVSPYWAPSLTPTAQIGAHKFYRFPGKKTETIASAAQ